MASISFSPGTVIPSTWLNAVNVAVYNTLPTLAPLISPTFTTPTLGAATATSINKNYFTQPATSCTWTLADGKTLNVSNTLTFSGTDGASLALGAGTNTFSGTFNGTSSGTNTGDQTLFKSVAVSGQSTVTATTTTDTLNLVAGPNVSLTTDSTAKTVTINGTSALSLVLNATISSSVSLVDYLNVFSAAYDHYIIHVENLILGGTNPSPVLLFATAGTTVDTTAKYNVVGDSSFTSGWVGRGSLALVGTTAAQGTTTPLTCRIEVYNVNSSGPKMVTITSIYTTSATPNNQTYLSYGGYGGTTAITGFRLNAAGSAGTITSGTIRVYGYKNV